MSELRGVASRSLSLTNHSGFELRGACSARRGGCKAGQSVAWRNGATPGPFSAGDEWRRERRRADEGSSYARMPARHLAQACAPTLGGVRSSGRCCYVAPSVCGTNGE